MNDLPDEVPVLTSHHFCRGRFNGPNETHCLEGWIIQVFGSRYLIPGETARNAIENQVGSSGLWSIHKFNDDRRNSKRRLAQVWNRAMASLGYVVGNPEAKNFSHQA